MSLRARLLILVAVATLVPSVLVGLRFFQNRTSEIEAAYVQLSAMAKDIVGDLDGKIQGTAQLQYGLSRARDLDSSDVAQCSAFLSGVREEYPQYTGILTIRPDGSLLCDSLRTGRTLDLRDRGYFKRALATNDVVTLEPAFGRLTGISVLQIAFPARTDNGTLKYVLLASFNLQKFAEHHEQRLAQAAQILLVDRQGTVLARRPGDGRHQPTDASIAGTDLFRFVSSAGGDRIGEVTGRDGDTQVWAVAAPPAVRETGMHVLVGRHKSELVAAANRRLIEDTTVLTALSLLLFAGVWALAELGIRRPVGRLTAMAGRLGSGDLSARVPPPYPGGELGTLMTVLNGTAESLERQRASIEDLNQKLHQSQKMEALGQLTGGLAHDFNNLLTVVLGNVEHLSERLAGHPELRSLAEGAVSAAERGAELTKSLLAFSRRQPLKAQDIDVGRHVAGMEIMLQRAAGPHIECRFVVGESVWPATVDPAQLESALLNLVLNARDAMPNGGRLTVEVCNAAFDEGAAQQDVDIRPGDYVMVAVTDTGSGMTREVLARAFEPFFTTKGVGKGTGLGLSMAYGFARQSGGAMKIYSEPGLGTAVKLYLPRAQATQRASATRAGPPTAAGGTETILVVEDDAMVRPYVEAILRSLGYRVILATNGADALEILRRPGHIDLLFTDIVMPGGMFGTQLAEAAARVRPGLKVLYTSGYSENAFVGGTRLDPDIRLLNKPYRRQELAEMVRSVLDGPDKAARNR